jgi:protein-S-isoprenylcysteine O-methyltransferase Ste14
MTQHARIGPVVGLALLAGGTAGAAVSERGHSSWAVLTLVLLAFGVGCALVDEVRKQARRNARWNRTDTANAVLLGGYAAVALAATLVGVVRLPDQVVGALLAVAYAGLCGYFVWRRRRAVAPAGARG